MFELLHIKIQIRFTFRIHDFWCYEYPKAFCLYNFLLFCKYPLLILSLTCFLFLLYFLKQNWLEIFQNVSETQRFFWDANAIHFLTSSTFFWSVLVFSFLPFFLFLSNSFFAPLCKLLFFFTSISACTHCGMPSSQYSFPWDIPLYSMGISVYFYADLEELGSGVRPMGRAFESKL